MPESCSQQVQAVMNECLKHEPKIRPIYVDIDIRLRSLDNNKRYAYTVSDLVVE